MSRIDFNSEVGKGTNFFFQLPLKFVRASKKEKSGESDRRENSLRVLRGRPVVIFSRRGQKPSRQFLMQELSKVKNQETRWFQHARELLSTLKDLEVQGEKPPLCFIDTWSGFENEQLTLLLHEIREITPDIFVVASMSQRHTYHTLLGESKCATLIMKPFYKDLVINSVAAAVQGSTRRTAGQRQSASVPEVIPMLQPSTPKLYEDEKSKILMAEDNHMNQKLQTRILRMEDLPCDVVENGLKAVRIFEQRAREGNPYRIVLMDFHMPEMDGKEATLAIREFEERHHLPPCHIIGLTACSGPSLTGMCDTIIKPIKKSNFIQVVKRFLAIPTCECASPMPSPPPE